MSEGEGCGNRKSDVVSLGRKLKLHLLVYIIDNRYVRSLLPHYYIRGIDNIGTHKLLYVFLLSKIVLIPYYRDSCLISHIKQSTGVSCVIMHLDRFGSHLRSVCKSFTGAFFARLVSPKLLKHIR
jgi:hypothetical protein